MINMSDSYENNHEIENCKKYNKFPLFYFFILVNSNESF